MSGFLDLVVRTAYLNGNESTKQLIRSAFGFGNINHPKDLDQARKDQTELDMMRKNQSISGNTSNNSNSNILRNMR